MEVYEVDSSVCGHHVFEKTWTPFILNTSEMNQIPEIGVILSSSSVIDKTFVGWVRLVKTVIGVFQSL